METLQRTANRGSISTGGYEIDNSCKFETDNTEYLERATGGGNGDTQKHTISVWVKRTELSNGTNTYIMGFNGGRLRFETNDIIEYQFRSGRKLETTAVYRDTSAWYHLVVVADSTLATSTDRMKLWVNGVRVTDFTTYIPQDQNQGSPLWGVYNTYNFRVGGGGSYTSDGINGYLSEVYYINGQTLDPTDFGEFDDDSGIWKPKAFTGTFGSLDNYLDFSNSSNLGEDANGGTDLSSNNITAADQSVDTPTNNFCTLNVISAIGDNTYTEGATKGIANAQNEQAEGTFMINKGKWYFEAQNITSTGAMFGFGKPNNWATGNPNNPGNDTSSFALANDGNVYYNSNTAASGWSTNATTDKVMIAIDLDNGFCYFGKNGTWGNSGDPTSGATGTGGFNYVSLVTNISLGDELVPALRISYTQTHGAMFNFGGYTVMSISSAATDENGYGNFEYAPPSGYYALCTKNLAEYG